MNYRTLENNKRQRFLKIRLLTGNRRLIYISSKAQCDGAWNPNLAIFRNEIRAAWQTNMNIEMILISEFVNSEIRITSTYRVFARLAAGLLLWSYSF